MKTNEEKTKTFIDKIIVKEKIRDLQFALNSVCYDADLIQKLEQVWDKFNLLKELIENSNNENS
jgi:hypothetical protein